MVSVSPAKARAAAQTLLDAALSAAATEKEHRRLKRAHRNVCIALGQTIVQGAELDRYMDRMAMIHAPLHADDQRN